MKITKIKFVGIVFANCLIAIFLITLIELVSGFYHKKNGALVAPQPMIRATKTLPLGDHEIKSSIDAEPVYHNASMYQPPAGKSENLFESVVRYDIVGPTVNREFIEVEWMVSDPSDILFSVTVNTDHRARRVHRDHEAMKKRAQVHFLGLGDSFTWGEGVEFEDTFTYQTALHSSRESVSYILAYHGYGIGDLVARTEKLKGLADITPKRGMAVLSIVGDSLLRFVNTTEIAATWGKNLLTLREIRTGEFRVAGPYYKVNPLLSAFQRYFYKSNFRKLFSLEWPRIHQSHADQMARAINYLKRSYQSATAPDNRFVVVLLPNNWTEDMRLQVRKALDNEKIEFVDYSTANLDLYLPSDSRISRQGHFTGIAYHLLGRVLARDLQANTGDIAFSN